MLGRQVDGHRIAIGPQRRLETRLAQDPDAQRHHLAAFLRQRDELRGRHHAAHGMVPAHQRLIPLDLARLGRRLHLEMQFERPPVERPPQIDDQLAPGAHRIVHLRVVEARLARMDRLGAVHGEVRLRQQRVRIPAVMNRECDADIGPDRRGEAIEDEGRVEDRAQPIEEVGQLLGQIVGNDRREFVAAQTADAFVGTQRRRHPRRQRHQQLIARQMAIGVVDHLEPRQVHHDDGHAQMPALTVETALQFFVEAHAIGQIGQPVVHRHATQPAIGFALRMPVDQRADRSAADDDQRRDRRRHGQRVHGRRRQAIAQADDGDMHRRHAAEVERHDTQREQAHRPQGTRTPRLPRAGEGGGAEPDRQQYRHGDDRPGPGDDAVDVIGRHAEIVHQRDGRADDAATQYPRAPTGRGGQRQAGRRYTDGDQKRTERLYRIEDDRRRRAIGHHRDEMSRPDHRAGGHCGQHHPAQPAVAIRRPDAVEQLNAGRRADQADQRRQQDEMYIMLRETQGDVGHAALTPRAPRRPSITSDTCRARPTR